VIEPSALRSGAVHSLARRLACSVGYDLNHLFIGAEGTLGVITELTVKVCALSPARSRLTCR
jgi:FAD/FMN-containing dehydrogenase